MIELPYKAAELAVLRNRERRLPRYAEAFSAALAVHMRELMPQFRALVGDHTAPEIRGQGRPTRSELKLRQTM